MAGHLGRLAVGPEDGQALRVQEPRHQDLAAARDPHRHPDRVADRAAPAVDGKLDDLASDQLAELAVELEPRLVAPVVRLRRAPDRRQELRAADDLVDHGRDVVLPAAGAEEAQGPFAVHVPAQELRHVAAQVQFRGEGRRQVEGRRAEVILRDLLEHLLDTLGADLGQHARLDPGCRDSHPRMGAVSVSHVVLLPLTIPGASSSTAAGPSAPAHSRTGRRPGPRPPYPPEAGVRASPAASACWRRS